MNKSIVVNPNIVAATLIATLDATSATVIDEQQQNGFASNQPKNEDLNVIARVESPLLPIREDSQPETNNNHSNNNNHNNKSVFSTPSNISVKGLLHHQHSYTAVDTSSPLRTTTQIASARKRSTGNLTQPTTPFTTAQHIITTPIVSGLCRRRSSTPSVKIDGSLSQITTTITTDGNNTDTNTTSLSDNSNNINNNNNGDTCTNYNYTAHTNHNNFPHRLRNHHNNHSHRNSLCQHNLYPKDSFSSIEGQAPKPSSKMQTKVDAVGRITGEWGKWQLRTVLLIFLCKIPSSWFMACIIFTAPAPRHGEFYCKPPSNVVSKNHTEWIKIIHPMKEEVGDKEFALDLCNVYEDAQEHAHSYYHYDRPELEPHIWEEPIARNSNVVPCSAFEHKADYHSVVTQYDLVCSRDILVSVTQFFHLFGVLTGGILANHLLKYFSPRNVMLFGMVSQIFCGTLTGQVSSYELHVFFRCLSAVCCAQMYTAGGMIMADITGGVYKTCVSTLFEQFWSIGVIMLPGVASFFKSWSHIYIAISWPTVILIYLWQWIPDSPRWMIARGRVLDAKKILLQCIDVNGTRYSLPHDIDQQLQLQAMTAMDAPPPAGWWSLWKGPKAVRHMICVHLCWSIYIVVYYGMLLNIRTFGRDHLEINTIIAGICEIIGTFIGLFLILFTTRKWMWTGIFNIVAGCIAYLGWLVPNENEIPHNGRVALLMLSAMISKIAISTTLSILTTCTVELVTDEKKKICAFSTICWARFWLLGAPFIGATSVIATLLPQTAFSSLAILGGVITTLISSSRTIPRNKPTLTTQHNMATATQMAAASNHTNDEKLYTKGHTNPIFTSITKITAPNSNLPPQLMPGIWTTNKNHEDNPPV